VIKATVSAAGAITVTRSGSWRFGSPIINPLNAENQAQGSALDGISQALGQGLTIDGGRVWRAISTACCRCACASPTVEVHFLVTDHPPTGPRRAASRGIARARNAIFAATGKRIRSLR